MPASEKDLAKSGYYGFHPKEGKSKGVELGGPGSYRGFGLKEEKRGAGPSEDKAAEDDEYPKHVGGGVYELSSGKKVKGKAAAKKAEAKL